MKKLLLLIIALAVFSYSYAQTEVVVAGDMENELEWTVLDVTVLALDMSTVTFDYQADGPSGGEGGCLSIEGYGQTRNFIYQPVTLTPGNSYQFTCEFKDGSLDSITNYWVELWLAQEEPFLTAVGDDWGVTDYDYLYQMHSWKSIDGIPYNTVYGEDGSVEDFLPLSWNAAGASGDSILNNPKDGDPNNDTNIFRLPEDAITDWYVGIKVGCGNTQGVADPTFNMLYDNVSLLDLGYISNVENLKSDRKLCKIYPNPSDGVFYIANFSGKNPSFEVYNSIGMLVKSGDMNTNVLDLTDMDEGIYFINVASDSGIETHKLVIK